MRRRNAIPRNSREALAKERALAVLGFMRHNNVSLTAAAKAERIDPRTVRRYVGSAIVRTGQRKTYRAKPHDRFTRPLNFLTAQGEIPILVRGSRAASKIGEYLNAIKRSRNSGDISAIVKFRKKTIRALDGSRHEFLTDTNALDRLADAGLLEIEGLYRVTQGGMM
jgi:hypothetical protein